jgi:hypothetical protein
MATKGKKLGPRVTVQFAAAKKQPKGSKTKGGAVYVYMRKETADFFGFKIVPSAGVKTSKGYTLAVRGSFGAGSIKVPDPTSKDKPKYKRIPVPASATIADIQKFLKTATKNKPQQFASVDGRTYPIVTTTK